GPGGGGASAAAGAEEGARARPAGLAGLRAAAADGGVPAADERGAGVELSLLSWGRLLCRSPHPALTSGRGSPSVVRSEGRFIGRGRADVGSITGTVVVVRGVPGAAGELPRAARPQAAAVAAGAGVVRLVAVVRRLEEGVADPRPR